MKTLSTGALPADNGGNGGAPADPLTDHEYDGIREFDNPTPGWWHLIFFASIVFAAFYFFFYTFSPLANSVHDDWKLAQTSEFKRVFGALGQMSPDEATILKVMGEPKLMDVAQGIFAGNCSACHAKDGGGINGVNLTDNNYKNVTKIEDIFRVIAKGAANGAMPSWEGRLNSNERIIVAGYVASLRGTKPARPKEPEGTVIPPWPSPSAK